MLLGATFDAGLSILAKYLVWQLLPLRLNTRVKKSLSTRTHICPHCGHMQDRDRNAAINILKKGLSTVGHTGINAWGENDLYLKQVTGFGQVDSRNQESPDLAKPA
jgi:Putative transposase DNA-binding domain